ncbi:MAG: shikimate dehydrogenase [Gammaproteobacteria bacterium]|nr:shikimate dehydrogenase [Gammaproteobacteria bacterium]
MPLNPADRYAVIGHPVAHSRSPRIHALFAAQTGQSLVYERIDAPPAAFPAMTRDFFAGGGRGLSVTLPHKEAAVALCARLTPRAARAHALNTLKAEEDGTLLGDNTDGAGLVRDLESNLGVGLAGRRILLLGAGGAVRGVLAPLLERAPAEIVIANRTAARARQLAAEFAGGVALHGCGLDEPRGVFDLVINGTSASLGGELPALQPGCIGAATTCYDLAYGHEDTVFVRWARLHGAARTVMGLGMLVEQAAEAFWLWRGVRPDTAPVLAALLAE